MTSKTDALRRRAGIGATVLAACVTLPARPASAQDASFGCKVLLCAAASAPGWSGIPYCVPVMEQLFSNLAHGQGWPGCAEASASGVGYDPYQACPAGLTPAAGNPALCADLSKPQEICTGARGGCATGYPTTPRPLRADPYYIDLTSGNGTQRFYFSLRGF
jgi:hypothetical protein